MSAPESENPYEAWAWRSSEFWVRRMAAEFIASLSSGEAPHKRTERLVGLIMENVLGYKSWRKPGGDK